MGVATGRESSDLDQSHLVRVEFQTELIHPLPHFPEAAFGTVPVLGRETEFAQQIAAEFQTSF